VIPGAFAYVHATRRTPWFSILVTTLVAMVLVATGTLADLASVTSLLLLVVFVIVNVSVLRLRRDPVAHEHFRVPSIVPVLGIVVCATLLTQQEPETFARAGALLAPAVLLWLLDASTGGRRRTTTTQSKER
jgi:amino acid transporter